MTILDLVFPKTCLGCGKEGKYLCQECVSGARVAAPACPHCGIITPGGASHKTCSAFGLDGVVSLWRYQGVIRKAVLALKYRYATEVGGEVSQYFCAALEKSRMLGFDFLIPVPMHWHRQNTRGFNQASQIGAEVARRMGWKFSPEAVKRIKNTRSQVELKGQERRQNLKGAFRVDPNFNAAGGAFVVFDDVFTTGSTLNEVALKLKEKGAKKVWGLTIAR